MNNIKISDINHFIGKYKYNELLHMRSQILYDLCPYAKWTLDNFPCKRCKSIYSVFKNIDADRLRCKKCDLEWNFESHIYQSLSIYSIYNY